MSEVTSQYQQPDQLTFTRMDQYEFGALAERYRRELQAHCYRLMGSISDAEDMVQETFLRAWRGRTGYEGRASIRAWLYKIATNACLDALKKQRRRFVPLTREAMSTLAEPIPPEVSDPVWLEPYPDELLLLDDDSPEGRLSARENIRLAFIAALHLLPPRQRAILILRDVLNLQANEVADILEITESAVKSALHRARSSLARSSYDRDAVSSTILDDATQTSLKRYVIAWETADVPALIALLKEDATFSMPPIPSWYHGVDTIRDLVVMTIFRGQAQGRWQLLPTQANHQPAFGLYRQSETRDRYQAYGIQVITFQGDLITDIITFRNPDLFPYFNLPLTISSSVVR